MKSTTLSVFFFALACAPVALAQKWEIGGGAGGGFYTSQDITGSGGSATAKFASNIAASAWLGNNSGRMISGEFRYDFHRGDAKLNGSGSNAAFAAQSHAVHYDMHLNFGAAEGRVQPFLAAGGGVKVYQGTGSEVVYQPLSNVGLLTKTNDLRPLVSVGGGIKFAIARNIGLRAEVHDYMTPFPNKVIAPSINQKVGGWVQDIVVNFGISILF